MKSIQLRNFGDPLKVLQLVESPDPKPQEDEIRIKMRYSPINPSDFAMIRGVYGEDRKLPSTAGGEGMGYIDKVGKKVKGFKSGQRVIPIANIGKWSEYIICKPDQVTLISVPDGISDQTASQFLVNPLTAWIMTVEGLRLKKDEWLLQTASGSTLGRMIIQIAKMKGFKTINLVRRREQVEELLNLGADVVLCTEDTNIVRQVFEITKKGVHGAIDAVGGETGAIAASCLRNEGKLYVFGLLSGLNTPINTGEMIFKGSIIQGFWLSRWLRKTESSKIQSVFNEMLTLLKDKRIVPPIEAEYDLTDYQKALEHSVRSGRSGKVLLRSL